jgi:hypothetical protein
LRKEKNVLSAPTVDGFFFVSSKNVFLFLIYLQFLQQLRRTDRLVLHQQMSEQANFSLKSRNRAHDLQKIKKN